MRILSRSCIDTIAGRKNPSSIMNASSSSSITTIFFPTSEKPPTVCILRVISFGYIFLICLVAKPRAEFGRSSVAANSIILICLVV